MTKFVEQVRSLPETERAAYITSGILGIIARHLQIAEDDIQVDQPFSLLNSAWQNELVLWSFLFGPIKNELGLYVYTLDLAENDTIQKLAEYLATDIELPPYPTTVNDNLYRGGSWPWDLPASSSSTSNKNLSSIFILAPPRSGTTLLRLMMDGHSALFVPGELHLLMFASMGRRKELTNMLHQSWLRSGLHMLWDQLQGDDDEIKLPEIHELEEQDAPIHEVVQLIQRKAQGKIFVDKSPSNPAHQAWLAQLEEMFEQPKYIHLVRHPCAVIESFVRLRFYRLLGKQWLVYNDNPWHFAENLWTTYHRNILLFLETIPADRQHVVRYEDLVESPQQTISEICVFLDIPYQAAMLDPFSDTRIAGVGDPSFRSRNSIEKDLAWRWRETIAEPCLHGDTVRIAQQFGYES